MNLASLLFFGSSRVGDTHDQQRVDPLTKGVRVSHEVETPNVGEPEKFRVRDVEGAPIGKKDREGNERLAQQTPPDFTEHGRVIRGSWPEPALPPACGSFFQTDDHRGIEIFRRIQLVIGKKEDVVLRTDPYRFATRDKQLAPIVQPNDERFKRHFCLANFDFIQHAGNVQSPATIRKAYF